MGPLSVAVSLADDIDIGRGDVIVSSTATAHLPVSAREIEATVCWLADRPLRAGDRLALKHTTVAPAPPCRNCNPPRPGDTRGAR